jgi:hypothetical protein
MFQFIVLHTKVIHTCLPVGLRHLTVYKWPRCAVAWSSSYGRMHAQRFGQKRSVPDELCAVKEFER